MLTAFTILSGAAGILLFGAMALCCLAAEGNATRQWP